MKTSRYNGILIHVIKKTKTKQNNNLRISMQLLEIGN